MVQTYLEAKLPEISCKKAKWQNFVFPEKRKRLSGQLRRFQDSRYFLLTG